MDPIRTDIFDLARRRMAWAEQRQAVLAKNIANANTPGYQPSDLPDFAKTLSGTRSVAPLRTQALHMGASGPESLRPLPPAKHTHALDGNAVALDQELTKVADTETMQSLTTTIYKKYMGLFSLALGKGGL